MVAARFGGAGLGLGLGPQWALALALDADLTLARETFVARPEEMLPRSGAWSRRGVIFYPIGLPMLRPCAPHLARSGCMVEFLEAVDKAIALSPRDRAAAARAGASEASF
jgi:hypothetical protein